jgi:hypothetical protein
MTAVDRVIRYWRMHDVVFLHGVSSRELERFEERTAVTLPNEMREFYHVTNGTHVPNHPGQDHLSYEFYMLQEIARDADVPWAWNFADYRELSWWYAIDLDGAGPLNRYCVYLLGAIGGKPLVIADSFEEFLGLYVDESLRLRPDGALAYQEQRRRM